MRWTDYPTRSDQRNRTNGTPRTGVIICPAPEHGRRWVRPTDGADPAPPVKVQVHQDEDRNYSLAEWQDTAPAPLTPAYTHPDVFTIGIEQGWAEAETDPARIDWPARQAAAAIPFEVVDGRPVNPCAETGVRYGRNEMGYWGETLMADALVTVTVAGCRYLLMVERGDGYGWAVPGGHVEPGETAMFAAVRELAEETGLALFGDEPFLTLETFHVLAPRYVPDPRASDEAWAVTVPVYVDLGEYAGLPFVAGGDDARRADWIRADAYDHLVASLEQSYGGRVFAAHTDMLRQFLGGAS